MNDDPVITIITLFEMTLKIVAAVLAKLPVEKEISDALYIVTDHLWVSLNRIFE